MFAEPADLGAWLRVDTVRRGTGNIAGVAIPVLQEVVFARATPHLAATPA